MLKAKRGFYEYWNSGRCRFSSAALLSAGVQIAGLGLVGLAPAFVTSLACAQDADQKTLNRLSKQEDQLLNSSKQTSKKTIEGLSTQVEVLQMQQDKLVEELLKYRRMMREAKTVPSAPSAPLSPPPGDGPPQVGNPEELLALKKREAELSQENTSLRSEYEKLKRQVSDLQAKLQDQEQLVAGIPALKRQLQETKNQLLMKQTEVQLFSKGQPPTSQLPSSTTSVPNSAPPPKLAVNDAAKQKLLDEVMERSGRIAGEETVKGKAAVSDVFIIEVRADKANLRSGAGAEHAPVMQVQKGTRLTVEEREGDWYRVISPTGGRAYVTADVVAPVRPDGRPRSSIATNPLASSATVGAGRGGAERRPGKQVARAVIDESFEPFGTVQLDGAPARASAPTEPTVPKDDLDRAFMNLKKGVPPAEEVSPERE